MIFFAGSHRLLPSPVATVVGLDPTIPVDRSEIQMACRPGEAARAVSAPNRGRPRPGAACAACDRPNCPRSWWAAWGRAWPGLCAQHPAHVAAPCAAGADTGFAPAGTSAGRFPAPRSVLLLHVLALQLAGLSIWSRCRVVVLRQADND
jgi:hypothetical protein